MIKVQDSENGFGITVKLSQFEARALRDALNMALENSPVEDGTKRGWHTESCYCIDVMVSP